MPPLSPNLSQAISAVVREEWGRILSVLVGQLGSFDLAEDCLQDAVVRAMKTWPDTGLPKSPTAWLLTTARRRAIDQLRRQKTFAQKQGEIGYLMDLEKSAPEDAGNDVVPDDRLRMIFTCCHPAIEEKARVALTLRTLGGLTTDQIAAAFLDRPDAMAQRLVRAKKKIRLAGIAYKIPEPDDLGDRLSSVLRVLYLIFNEGYAARSGDQSVRADLSDEAIRLARILRHLMPEQPEVEGLLALMLLHDSRRHTRTDRDGRMVALEDQNRARWDRAKIREGIAILKRCLPQSGIGPYQLQAAISAVHAESATWEATDWAQIVGLYQLLHHLTPTPVVGLNLAIALSYAETPAAGLKALSSIGSEGLDTYQPYHAARADLLARNGQRGDAITAYGRAMELSGNREEAAFLRERMRRLMD